jgi:hypothetical protein
LTKRIQRGLPILFASLIGCGGATPQASSASDDAPPVEDSTASQAHSDGSEAKTEKESEAPEATGGTAASADDVRSVLQLVIDDEALDPFLHLDQAGRFPLAVSGPNVPEGLIKSTKPVRLVSAPASKKDAVLVFTKIEVDGKHASVAYRYDIEGVRGTASLDKGEHGWTLTRSKVAER